MTGTIADAIRLTAKDGHSFAAYCSKPAGKAPRGGVVVVQEIFGVNRHIRSVADRYAAQGYLCLAPALFERVEPGMEMTYDADGIAFGRETRGKVSFDQGLADMGAAVDWLKQQGHAVGLMGFCWGGALTWMAACHLPIAAAASFYGGGIENLAGANRPKVPLQLHYGLKDAYIPAAARDAARAAAPKAEYYEYDADHGFCCDERGSYDAPSCKQAEARVLDLLHRHVG